MAKIGDRFRHAWNAFTNKDPTFAYKQPNASSYRPDRVRLTRGNERSIVTAVLNRIAIDCSQVSLMHVRLDENNRYIYSIDSGLNECLTLEANVDQTGRAFIQDAVLSMFDEGTVALVPTDTDVDAIDNSSFDILTMRTGRVTEWYPASVKVKVYNEQTGNREEITLPKRTVSLVENPLYAVMNDHNSTLQRLIRKLALLDVVDEQSSSGKLDLIIQLPYVIKTEARQKQAENRRKAIEDQLTGSKYGIAYTDGSERITQLNRAVENNLLSQVEYLTSMLFSQLGVTQGILDGTADENTMNNYYNRTIEPIMSAIADEMKRKFLTKTARTQKQSICFFRDPFKLVPVSQLAELADKLTRNEILTSNEVRQIVGLKPSQDPAADELRNKNLSTTVGEEMVDAEAAAEAIEEPTESTETEDSTGIDYDKAMSDLNGVDDRIAELEKLLEA